MEISIFIALFLIFFTVWALWVYPKSKKPLRLKVFSPAWRDILTQKVGFYKKLDAPGKLRFEERILSFLSRCKISAINITITDEDKLLVAASAVIPIFGFPSWEYPNLNEVLLYPNSFNSQYETAGAERNILGQVGWGYMNGTMVLSKPALHQGFNNENSKSNVGIHEFVHLIDKSDGAIDGIPEALLSRQYVIPWIKMMHHEMSEIKSHHSDLSSYGAVSEGEFFSVVSEYFFNAPELLEKKHPSLYGMLQNIFKQDLVQ